MIALTAFRDEIHETDWEVLLKSPVKTMMRLLLDESETVELLAPPWGRSFQRAGKKVQPNMATSVQCHVRICKDELRRFMKASGGPAFTLFQKLKITRCSVISRWFG